MSRLGVRARVVGAFALVMLVLLAAAGLAIRQGVADRLTDATDDQLETRAAATARLLVDRGPAPGLTEGLDDPGESFTQVIGPDEQVVLATPGLPDAPLLEPERRENATEGVTIRLRGVDVEPDEGDEELDTEALEETESEPFEDDRARIIARTVTVNGEELSVVVGNTLEDREDALQALGRVLLIALPLALLLACATGWFAVGAALRPVERMRRRAAGISETSLDERLPLPEADDELRRLGQTLNAMLGRLEEALERERSFVADASHELRTPLAILRTELELAIRGERTPDELRAAVESALEETAQLTTLTDDLLLLARSDHGRLDLARAPVDLRALADQTAARFAARTEITAAGPSLTVDADGGRLEQALSGLVENAIRHGAPPIELRVEAPATLVVADRGPGVPDGVDVFERFTRGDAARTTEGTGLGLPIVRAIVAAHGGTVELRERDGGGTEAVVTLPTAAAR